MKHKKIERNFQNIGENSIRCKSVKVTNNLASGLNILWKLNTLESSWIKNLRGINTFKRPRVLGYAEDLLTYGSVVLCSKLSQTTAHVRPLNSQQDP